MPAVNITISETEHKKLQDDYEKMAAAWALQGRQSSPPSFDHWVSERLTGTTPVSAEEISHMRVFSAIEQLVTSMHVHGLCLANVAGDATPVEKPAHDLAQELARRFDLPQQYVKRLQDVFTYYQKNVASLVDGGAGTTVLHSGAAMERAYEDLLDRTTKALDHLEPERAIGRIEGAIAILVSLDVMGRDSAKEKTLAFKSLARAQKKA
ncbi:hypothetical protein [Janthinobacterium sp. 17J80-10]|uniref:hypothetical protein n=1 Tax=Janthinobacterium sp. 17J80-10 TaxID=2497863 RepID=UPI0010054195|nr:hypothetical protein [Janthinobacterium sp. 17J80-10]QAU34214.1 hypothetical protein EKL02_08455 [Janthinobacterium sp. 17J80-10]